MQSDRRDLLVSVVVPVYNVKPYVQECLNSITGQSYPLLEIIVVDDGSTDGSGEICDETAGKDPRICVLHQTNKGLSEARNTGIRAATGEYICFIDSDDRISPFYVQVMMECAILYHADICICGYSRIDEKGTVQSVNRPDTSFTGSGKSYTLKTGLTCNYAWNKLYKRSLFQDARFPPGKTFEDIYIMHEIFEGASRISFISAALYDYRIRADSISGHKNLKNRIGFLEAVLIRLEYLVRNGAEEQAVMHWAYEYARWEGRLLRSRGATREERGRLKALHERLRQILKMQEEDSLTPRHRKDIRDLVNRPRLYRLKKDIRDLAGPISGRKAKTTKKR